MADYPVLEIIPKLKQALAQERIVILQAPPGAGKSTVLPLHLLDEPWLKNKKIIMLEPRRLATRSVALRLAALHGEAVGGTIGYRIRFEANVSKHTRIEVVTEGILTRMIQSDNTLEDVGLVILDEYHERSLQADLALALCLQVQHIVRDDLRILLMSATLDGAKLSELLGNASVITSEGKQHPVVVHYVNTDNDMPITFRMVRSIKKALKDQKGDILAFLPGAGEIMRVTESLEIENSDIEICPLYGDLPFAKQQEAILPHPKGKRKIVLSTSIAETSLTIEGITTVIDSGLARIPRFDPRSGLTRLETVRATKDAADQRTGRAGRLGPGVCYRLWAEGTHQHLLPHRVPEIAEADLAPLLLELSQWGITDINELTWITPPPAGALSQAKELLQQLEAIEDNIITSRGKEMVKLPTHPRIAHMLIEAFATKHDGISIALATDLAALLEERDPLIKQSGADITLRLETLRKWRTGERVNADRNILERVERLASSWRRTFKIQEDNSIVSDKQVGLLLSSAYPERIAKQMEKNGERYKLMNGRVVRLPPHDPLMHESWLAVAHLDAGSSEGKIFLAAPLLEADLHQHAQVKEIVRWDEEREMITATRERRIGNLVLESNPVSTCSQAQRIHVLRETIRSKGLKLLGWDEAQEAWQAQIMSLRKWRPVVEGWPDVSENHLLKTLDQWISPYLLNISKKSELQRLDLPVILMGLLSWDLQSQLERLVPSKLKVPSGSMIPLSYFQDGSSPVMEVRLQEVFGMLETPSVNESRVKVTMHLLSPGFRPVQVTQDLHSFWKNTYSEVRKELRRRYPKHHWPEDPWTAQAVKGVKRKEK